VNFEGVLKIMEIVRGFSKRSGRENFPEDNIRPGGG
jgi:hypothetical protein